MVMIPSVVMAVIGGMPMVALFGVPCRVVGCHRDLARSVGKGGKEWREGKSEEQRKRRQPCPDYPPFAHLPLLA